MFSIGGKFQALFGYKLLHHFLSGLRSKIYFAA